MAEMKKYKKIFIAGGGTGGHIYPGIAIARALQSEQNDCQIFFIGTNQGLETKIVPREGFPLLCIQGGKLNFSGQTFSKILTVFKIPLGILQSFYFLLRHRPDFVLGVGGYASVPMMLAAVFLKFPTAIWEPNAYPGMANRWLARFVDRCFIVFAAAEKLLENKNISVFGMPVRAEMEKQISVRAQQNYTVENKNDISKPGPQVLGQFHILHYGGSQGSRAIGRTLCTAINDSDDYKNDPNSWLYRTKVIHQTGSVDYQDFQTRYRNLDAKTIELHEFIYDMPKFYQWADLVICRGGASTLSELAAFGLPAIVIPLPAADAHQEKNAEILVNAQAACMVLQKDLTPTRLIQEIDKLKKRPELLTQMRENIGKLHRPQGAKSIAKEILASC